METQFRRHIIGYLYLLASRACVTIGPFILKGLYRSPDAKYNHSFFIAYFCNIFYAVYIIPLLIQKFLGSKTTQDGANTDKNKENLNSSGKLIEIDYKLLKPAIIMGAVIMSDICVYALAVEYTSVASANIIQGTAEAFSFAFSLVLLGCKFEWIKFVAVMVCLSGVGLIGISDQNDVGQKSAILGDFIALISAITFALYISLTKYFFRENHNINWSLFFLYIGISNAILFAPLLAFLHITGLELFELPNLKQLLFLCCFGAISSVLPVYLLSVSTVYLEPVVVSIGKDLIIPTSMILDHYYEGKTYSFPYMTGCFFILLPLVFLVTYDLILNKKNSEKINENSIELNTNFDNKKEVLI